MIWFVITLVAICAFVEQICKVIGKAGTKNW